MRCGRRWQRGGSSRALCHCDGKNRAGRARSPPRRWHGQSVVRHVAVEESAGPVAGEAIRCVVVPSSQLAQQHVQAFATAHAHEAVRVAEPLRRVAAQRFACGAAAAEAIANSAGRGQGRRGRRPWRSHALHDRVEGVSHRQKRARRGRPPKTEVRQAVRSYRLVVEGNALALTEDEPGWTVLATTRGAEVGADTEMLQADHAQHTTVEPGCRWIKTPAAIPPVWLEQPERIAALALLPVVGFLGYAVIQRQVRLYLRDSNQQLPGHKGPTPLPTAAVILALFGAVTMGHFRVGSLEVLHVHGWQDHHIMVCDALGIDRSWYEVPPMPQNRQANATPP